MEEDHRTDRMTIKSERRVSYSQIGWFEKPERGSQRPECICRGMEDRHRRATKKGRRTTMQTG